MSGTEQMKTNEDVLKLRGRTEDRGGCAQEGDLCADGRKSRPWSCLTTHFNAVAAEMPRCVFSSAAKSGYYFIGILSFGQGIRVTVPQLLIKFSVFVMIWNSVN